MDCSPLAPLSVGFPQQEYCIGLPFPSPEYLPNPGIELTSPALQADPLPLHHLGNELILQPKQLQSLVLLLSPPACRWVDVAYSDVYVASKVTYQVCASFFL